MMKLQKKTTICLSAAALVLTVMFSGCQQKDKSGTVETVSESNDVTLQEKTVIDVSGLTFSCAKTGKFSDDDMYSASESSASPVGGNPVYYFFDEGLTYYCYDFPTDKNYKCTLQIPEKCTGGKIIYMNSGGGSGEMFITVSAEYGNETVYLSYYLYGCPSDGIHPAAVSVMDEDQTEQFKDMLNSHYMPVYRCDDVYITDETEKCGSGFMYIPSALTGYKVTDCKIILCDDGCDPHSVTERAYYGYAAASEIDEYRTYDKDDGWNYPVSLYRVRTVPEGGKEYRRVYLYLITLDETHYGYICAEPEKDVSEPENEAETVSEIIKNTEIEFHEKNY